MRRCGLILLILSMTFASSALAQSLPMQTMSGILGLVQTIPLPTEGYMDRIAADLNLLLVVIAIGLATLDVTFLITQKVVDHLPPVTRMTYDAAPTASN